MLAKLCNAIDRLVDLIYMREPRPSPPLDIGTAHLKYDSVEQLALGEKIPRGFIHEPDERKRNLYIRQYGALRRHLFDKHIATLSQFEQDRFAAGTHPSQSHQFIDEAETYCPRLKHYLESIGITSDEVFCGRYHMDRVVMTVLPTPTIDDVTLRNAPWLVEGFEIKYLQPNSQQEPETRQNKPMHPSGGSGVS